MASAGPAPANAVDPDDYFYSDVFSESADVNSLAIDYSLLTNKISKWIDEEVQKGGGHVMDQLSTFLLDSFTTLLTTYDPPPPYRGKIYTGLTTSDVLSVKNKLKEKLRPSLDELEDLKDNAKYTEFCSNFLGKMTCVEARAILEVLDPDPQCIAIVDEKTHCWICANKLNKNPKPECEHILPISDALLHLNLYQNRSSLERLNKYEVNILKLEYLWSHQCCNQSKNNLQYITKKGANYSVDRSEDGGIDTTITRIQGHSKPKGSYDCHAIFGTYKSKNPKFNHLTIKRIATYIDPIVDTINLHIKYLSKTGMIDKQKAFLVYEYLILARFFSRIPGCTIVEAFKKYYLSEDGASREAAAEAEKKIRKEMEDMKQMEDVRKEKIRLERVQDVIAKRAAQQAAIFAKQLEATERQKLAITGGKSRAERYAEKIAKEQNPIITQSIDITTRITTTTEDDTSKQLLFSATTIDNTISGITTTDNAVNYVATEGGAKKIKINWKPNPERWERMKENSEYSRVIREQKRETMAKIGVNSSTSAADIAAVSKLYDDTGENIYKHLHKTPDLYTEQDSDTLQLLYMIPHIQQKKHELTFAKDTEINSLLEEQSALEMEIGTGVNEMPDENVAKGGTYPNSKTVKIDPYAIIQNDFTTEKAFIYLLAYYPAYLRKNNLRSVSADQYMSTPHILRDTLKYFGIDPTEYHELLMNDGHGVAVSTSPQQNFAAFYAAVAKQKRSAYQPVYSPKSSPFAQAVNVFGGKRRTKKRRANKRRTHKKN